MPLFQNMPYVKATQLVDSKQATMPWDENQIRKVSLAFNEGDEIAAEQVVMEWQLERMKDNGGN